MATDTRHKQRAPISSRTAVRSYFSDRSQKWWATVGVSSIFGLVLLAQLKSLFGSAPVVEVAAPSENKQLAMYTDTQHPLANLGTDYTQYAAADSSEKLDLIFQSLENFDYWLTPGRDTCNSPHIGLKVLV